MASFLHQGTKADVCGARALVTTVATALMQALARGAKLKIPSMGASVASPVAPRCPEGRYGGGRDDHMVDSASSNDAVTSKRTADAPAPGEGASHGSNSSSCLL
jgi:hypothetical protein